MQQGHKPNISIPSGCIFGTPPSMHRRGGDAGDEALVVDPNGGGQFTTVQAAIDAIPANSRQPVIIHLTPGEYYEKILVPSWKPPVTLRGEDRSVTKITYDAFIGKEAGAGEPAYTTYTCCTVAVEANDFTAVNIRFENSAGPQCGGGSGQNQAVALRVSGDRAAFYGCHLSAWQDTLYAHHGHHLFHGCTIEGSVDFIFGGPNVSALFRSCRLHMRAPGWFTAHYRDLEAYPQDDGAFVFDGCTFVGMEGVPSRSGYLGRPWRQDARVILYNCHLSHVVNPQGWSAWDANTDPRRPSFWECGSNGPGASPVGRRCPPGPSLSLSGGRLSGASSSRASYMPCGIPAYLDSLRIHF